MKTVRLPIFEDGVETQDYLEVDITFFTSSTAGLRSNQAKIIHPQSYSELLEEFEKDIAKQEVIGSFAPAEEWRTIEGLPTKNFEVSQRGQVRIKTNKKILEPSLDLDSKNYMTVNVKINGLDFYINGPMLAEQMWSRV